MSVARRVGASMAGLVLLAGIAGCPDGTSEQIMALQRENADLSRERDELRNRLASALAERDAAMQRERSLAEQLRLAREAQRGPTEERDGWTFAGEFAWQDIAETVLFDSGKAVLRSGGREKLARIADDIRSKFPDKWVFVIGHTDNDPIKRTANQWIDNLDLSINRGATVTRELYSLGLPRPQLIAAGAGEYQPKVDNTTRANKQTNRRVQILLVPPPQRVGAAGDGAMPEADG